MEQTGITAETRDVLALASLPHQLFAVAARKGDAPFLWAKRGGTWTSRSWRAVADDVAALARALRALGLEPGDRVVLVSENRPEWLIADYAIMAAGLVTVPAYVTNTVDDHKYILSNVGARAVIVSTAALARRVLPAVATSGTVAHVIHIEPPEQTPTLAADIHAWDSALTLGREHAEIAVPAPLTRRDRACVIHTSGTGGAPKGVTLSHGAIMSNVKGAAILLQSLGLGNEVFLSFLPLSHSYEHTAGQSFPVAIGAEIYYAEGVDSLAGNLVEAKPTIMTAVPRLYETLQSRISRQVERDGGFKRTLFLTTLALGKKRYRGTLAWYEYPLDWLLDILVRAKVRARFGGRLKAMVSGGAPLNPDVGLFFTALGVRILQGYGQTESAPVVSCNLPTKVKIETVGPPIDGCEVMIANDGEILVRGELVMEGYWNDPTNTAIAIRDGWLHTGDIGEFDKDGFLRITDRKKDIIVNSGGDNISPARVEGLLTLRPEIAQAMVIGDKHPYLVAVIVPDEAAMRDWAAANGVAFDAAAVAADPRFRDVISRAIDAVNGELSVIERVRRFIFADEPFAIANGEMTPTLKVKRHAVKARYGTRLEALYKAEK
ncbi:MAG TPA: AMP-dependent synthetase/ligase [Alphaproteobacteria bacterium]|nr:AMP-dependent synthetase/ligase [Alphaproteobacteria bacterium]